MMATRKRWVAGTALLLAILLIAGAAVLARQVLFGPRTITAYFPTATAIYPGDEVRVSGVKVGTIDRIEPQGTLTKMTLKVDRDVPVPADAKAVIVAQNLVAARYVQLTPSYREGDGPTMGDGATVMLLPGKKLDAEYACERFTSRASSPLSLSSIRPTTRTTEGATAS